MKTSLTAKFVAVAALSAAALGASTAAQARTDVSLFLGVQAPLVYSQPQPVYVQPRTVYVQPEPIYESRVYVQPEPVYESRVYVQPGPVFVRQVPPAFYSYEHERRWRAVEWRREQEWRRHHGHHGRDRDDHHGDRHWD